MIRLVKIILGVFLTYIGGRMVYRNMKSDLNEVSELKVVKKLDDINF